MISFKDRKDKIVFLKGLSQGKSRVSDLIPTQQLLIVTMEENDGTRRHTCQGKVLSEKEVQQLENNPSKYIDIKRLLIVNPHFNDTMN